MKKSNKSIIIFIVLLIGLSTIFMLTIGVKLIKDNKNKDVIIVGNEAIFEKQDNKWVNISFADINNYNWKKYYTYIDNQYYGYYSLYNNEKWYLFKDKNQAVNYNGDLLALNGETRYKVVQFNLHDIENKDYITKVLNDNNIKDDSELSSSSVVYVDIDNDGEKEPIYTISNKFSMEDVGNTYFSFIFMVKNDKIIYLYKKLEKDLDSSYSGCKPYINSILDVDEDDQYELILSCGYYSNNGIRHSLYKFKEGVFKLLVSN